MSRPKYKTGEKDARGKIADAFWELIGERPYTEISVLDIVRKAKLNKNTFYYHYNGIDEMSKDIVEQSLDPAAFKRTDPLSGCAKIIQYRPGGRRQQKVSGICRGCTGD